MCRKRNRRRGRRRRQKRVTYVRSSMVDSYVAGIKEEGKGVEGCRERKREI